MDTELANIEQLSDLVHLCAATLREIARSERLDAYRHRADQLADELNRVAQETKRIATEASRNGAQPSASS